MYYIVATVEDEGNDEKQITIGSFKTLSERAKVRSSLEKFISDHAFSQVSIIFSEIHGETEKGVKVYSKKEFEDYLEEYYGVHQIE